jgi:outer membrane protein OmpA-like peptidoglycan-associated protein
MKKELLFIALILGLFFNSTLTAQFLLPEFNEPTKLTELSSINEESLPFPYKNGEKIYFVRTTIVGSMKERVKGQEIWSSEYDGTKWSEPTNIFEQANDNGNNAVIGTGNDGNTVYVFNSIQTRRRLAKGVAVTKKEDDGSWSKLEKVTIPGFKIGEGFYSFFMNPNENILLIGMASSDTSSQNDLYVSLKDANGDWSEVKNLGSTINSAGTELSPYWDEVGNNLYFSSTGHGGFGDADVFVSKRLDESWTSWTKPLNLGAPINSESFDAYFIIGNNNKVFFTSNRGQVYSDIYSTEIKEKVVIVNEEMILAQFNFEALPTENVTLLIFDENDNLIETAVTDANGQFSFKKLANDEGYKIKLADSLTDDFINAKVYLIDDKGKKMKRLSMNEDGTYTESNLDGDTELIEGLFEFDKLPKTNTAIVVLDENGFPLDTIYTDENGKFKYNKLSTDKNISFKPLKNEDDNFDSMAIHQLDENGKKKSPAKKNEDDTFAFVSNKKKEIGDNIEEVKEAIKDEATEVKSKIKKEVLKPSGQSVYSSDDTIYFDFNEKQLSNDDIVILDITNTRLKSNKNENVTLIGFTDNVGSKENNVKVASARARAARQYLTDKGIKSNRITIYGYGEVMFKGDNSTEEGRALNRRVEVSFQ